MTDKQRVSELIEKYNDILLESMKLALSEDLVNLIIVNKDDEDFGLVDFIKNKRDFKAYVLKEFLKQNSTPLKGLSEMEEKKMKLKKF
jgi:hypothetical protein